VTDEAVSASFAAASLALRNLETITESRWPGNPYDALPLIGERFFHRLVIAQKE